MRDWRLTSRLLRVVPGTPWEIAAPITPRLHLLRRSGREPVDDPGMFTSIGLVLARRYTLATAAIVRDTVPSTRAMSQPGDTPGMWQ